MEFDKEKKIEEYLAEHLPAREERIAAPMNPACEVCVVIPCYSEREFILNPLHSLARQEQVNPHQYEIIVVVNNPNRYREPPREDFQQVVKNNRETLDLLQFLNGQSCNITLAPGEKPIIKEIRQQGLKVYALDKSSPGKTLPDWQANVGGARNRGVAEAVERFCKQPGKNGIIAQTDADTLLDEYYIRNIIDAFKRNPQLVGLTGISDDIPQQAGDREMVFQSLKVQMVSLYHQLLYGLFFPADTTSFIPFNGSCMATRAIETVLAGGIPPIPGAEDTQLGFNLAKIGPTIKAEDVIAYPILRASRRTSTGRGSRIAAALEEEKTGVPQVQSIEAAYYLGQLIRKLQEARQKQQTTLKDIREIMVIDDHPLLDDTSLTSLHQHLDQLHTTWEDLLNPELKKILAAVSAGIEARYKPQSILAAGPLMINVYCLNPQVKNQFQTAAEQINRERRQDRAVLEHLVETMWEHSRTANGSNEITAALSTFLDRDASAAACQLLKKRYRLKRIARLITAATTKQEALQWIELNYMAHRFQPGQDPLLKVFFQLQTLSRALADRR